MGNRVGIGWDTQAVQPPAELFLAQETLVFAEVWQTVVGAVYFFQGQVLMATGQVIPFRNTITPVADRTPVTITALEKIEGFLLGLVFGSGDVVRSGQAFARAGIAHGSPAVHHDVKVLLQGKISNQRALNYPPGVIEEAVSGPGMLRSIAGTDPAANTEISETVPTNARWRLVGVTFALTTDGTAATRTVRLVIDDGTTTLFTIQPAATQIASLTRTYVAGAFGTTLTTFASEIMIPLPPDLYLFQGWRIRTATDSRQAGDNFGAPQLLVEEWIEE